MPAELPPPQRARFKPQRGAVAIMFGLTIVVLVALASLAVDLGRFFVIKAELQNAMDACSLAAATQLRPGQSSPEALSRAVAYGSVFLTGDPAIRNRADFQTPGALKAGDLVVEFADELTGNYQTIAAGADYHTAAFAKCSYPLAGLPIFFMKVLNPALGTQTISATAVATLAPSASACAAPVGVCKQSSGPNFGLTPGDWLSAPASAGATYGAGHFGWIDFDGGAGGAAAVSPLLAGTGKCAVALGQDAAEAGKKLDVTQAWNTRFGIYPSAGKPDEKDAPPDTTGYAYTAANWTPGRNAYSGTVAGLYNYAAASQRHEPYQFPVDTSVPPVRVTSQYIPGNPRRVVVAPVVDCNAWNAGTIPKLEGWACVLMLAPALDPANPAYSVEYLGLSTAPGSVCATHGEPGTFGPPVPQLVQ